LKSTLQQAAGNALADLALLGHKVMLVDGDTQNQVAIFLWVKPTHVLFEFITGTDENGQQVSKKEAITAARPNLWLLAGGLKLVELKNWLGEQPRGQRQTLLESRFEPKNGSLDYLIFDCAPGWDILSVNILMAASEILCPVALQSPSVEGLKTFFGYLLSAQKLNPDLQLKYVLPTMFDQRTRHSLKVLKQLLKLFRKQVCDPIPYNVRLSEAPAVGKTIFEFDSRAAGANGYKKLIRRIIDDDTRQ